MKTAFLFPGQGAQKVGMGKDLYEAFPAAKRVFDLAEEASGLPLKRLCFEGPEEELSRTDVCQPAVFTISAAVLAVMRDSLSPERTEAIRPTFAAGLSLGEYTALYAAEAIGLADAVRLVTRRGKLMQNTAAATPSGMVCIAGLDEAQAVALCRAAAEDEVLTCANFNCPGQIVLSGALEACRRAAEMARDFGASGAVPLRVAGGFHSELMRPAADEFAEAVEEATFAPPQASVVANVDALPHDGTQEIGPKLLAQLTSPVRWQQSMEYLLGQGVDQFLEIGPGRVLAGLMRRISRNARFTCVGSRKAIEALAEG